jgi:phage head maturation protease
VSEKNEHIEQAQEHLATALDHQASGRDSHVEARTHLGRVRELAERCSGAMKDGDTCAAQSRLADIFTATTAAHAAHSSAGSSFSRAHRSTQRAAESLDRALASEPPAKIDPIANPTGAEGAQVSNGQAPRGADAVYRARRNELAALATPGADASYYTRLRELAEMEYRTYGAVRMRKASAAPLYVSQLADIGEDEIAGICISAGFKRDDAEWVPAGVDLTAYRKNPVVIHIHDPSRIIGASPAIGLTPDRSAIGMRIQLAPAGTSPIVDEVRALIKGGFLNAISAGILPREVEHLPNGKVRVLTSELLEVSLVAVPADPDALITARSYSRASAETLLRSLPVTDPAARQRVIDAMKREQRRAELAELQRGFNS